MIRGPFEYLDYENDNGLNTTANVVTDVCNGKPTFMAINFEDDLEAAKSEAERRLLLKRHNRQSAYKRRHGR